MNDLRGRVVCGSFFQAPELGRVEFLNEALIEVDEQGRIAAVYLQGHPERDRVRSGAVAASRLVTIPAGCYVLPGFVDLHVHAPQYPQLGKALQVPLEVWLQHYTFPLEARYADLAFARRNYVLLVLDLLAQGTTTALYFSTIHLDATRLLVDICVAKGQRALVGKVAMDNPAECPDYYRDTSTEAGLRGTRALIDYVHSHPHNPDGRVRPVVTPRFIPSCTDGMLEGLGAIARDCRCHVQTHCSESDWEHGYVLARHGRTDAESLDHFGLLTRRTVLAHSNFLSDGDLTRLRDRGTGVAHCPLSNVYFSNAVFPLRAALDKGVRVGLGTDISGGPSASIFDSCRMAVLASRMLEMGVDPARAAGTRGRPGSRIEFREAFYLATTGGGEVLDLPVGLFAPGYEFDAMIIDPSAPAGSIRLDDELDDEEDALQKILFTASRANIATVWVGGKRVSGAWS